jgi:hypothetical protein
MQAVLLDQFAPLRFQNLAVDGGKPQLLERGDGLDGGLQEAAVGAQLLEPLGQVLEASWTG